MQDKIDFVIAWVDGSDKKWQLEQQAKTKKDAGNPIYRFACICHISLPVSSGTL